MLEELGCTEQELPDKISDLFTRKDDNAQRLLRNLLPPIIIPYIFTNTVLCDFVVLRVVQAIFTVTMSYDQPTELSDDQLEDLFVCTPRAILANQLACVMVKQYRRLSGSWEHPYCIPVDFLPAELVRRDKVITVVHQELGTQIEIYPDEYMPIAAYKNMQNIDYKIGSSFCKEQPHNVPRYPQAI